MLIAIPVVILLALGAGGANADAPVPKLDGPGVVEYPADGQWTQSTRFIVNGSRTADGGCEFSGEIKLRPGETTIHQRERAYDPAKCRLLVEEGLPTEPEGTDAAGMQGISDLQAVNVKADASEAAAATGTHSAGYLKSYYHDPLHLTVNEVKNTVDWWWNGTCVYGTVYLGGYYNWLGLTGWSLESQNWQYDAECLQAYSSSYAHYENPIFCAGQTTHTYYDRNTVWGLFDRWLYGQWNAYKSGGCNWLLHFHHSLTRTLN